MILGGGDGGLLKELLELPKGQVPAFITMVEIDEMVMTACSEFMPSVCGKYTKKENWEGPNYKVINGCAIQFMKDCQVENSYCKVASSRPGLLFNFELFWPKLTVHKHQISPS